MGQVVQVNGDYTIKASEGGTIRLDTGSNVGFVRVTGSLLVDGDTLTVSAENLNVKDNIIVLNFGETGAGVTLEYSGIQIDRGTLTPAAILFDEGADSWIIAEGTPESSFNYSNSNLRLRRVSTDSDTDSGDLTLIGFGTGVVKVLGTTDYEQQVTDDDDIPNKKYVDDRIVTTASFQLVRENTRVIAFDTETPLEQSFFPIGPYVESPNQDQIAVIVNNKRVALFTEEEFSLRGLSIFPEDNKGNDIFSGATGDNTPISQAITIQARDTNSGIRLETNGTGKVEISYALQFNSVDVGIAPAGVLGTTVIYNGPVSAGTSGLYAVNNNYRDELVLKSRALLFSMIF
jgi:hypothetical protein